MKPVNRNCSLVIIAGNLAFGCFASAATENFDALKPGPMPSSWEGSIYGPRADRDGVVFPVVATADPGRRNALRLNAVGAGGRARVLLSDVSIRDGYVQVEGNTMRRPQTRPDRPKEDPFLASIGIIWRYQDKNNYYSLSASGDRMHFTKRVDGDETRIANSPVVYTRIGEWYTVRVEFTGQTIKVFMNGREVYTAADIVDDPGLGGDIRAAGAVGVYTTEHHDTYFDNLSYGALASAVNEDFEDMYPLPPSGSHGGARHHKEDFAKIGGVGPIKPPWKFGSTQDAARVYPKGEPYWEIVEYRGGYSSATEFGVRLFKRTVITHALRQSGWGAHVWCVKSDTKIRDGYVEVLGKYVSGDIDRTIGVVWRFQDEKNYYIARTDGIEDSVVVFKVIDGLRSRALGRSRLIHMPADVWNLLRVDFSGNRFRVMWNGKALYTVTDDDITKAGAVGLWTKADSVTLYDNFSYGGNAGLMASSVPLYLTQPIDR